MLELIKEIFTEENKDVTDIKIDKWLDKNVEYGIYLLTDNKVNRTAKYFNDIGINIFDASDNIKEIGNKFIMDIDPSIILLVDTGSGIFSNAKAQEELEDIISAGDLSMNKAVIVFYTDSSIKINTLRDITKSESIKWLKYNGTVDIAKKLLSAGIKTEKGSKEFRDENAGLNFKASVNQDDDSDDNIPAVCLFGRRIERVNNAKVELKNCCKEEYTGDKLDAYEVRI